jgi:hypothetical protein
MDTPFGREGSEGSKGAEGSEGGGRRLCRQFVENLYNRASPVGKQTNRPAGGKTIQPRLWREGNAPLLVLRTTSPGGGSLLYLQLLNS